MSNLTLEINETDIFLDPESCDSFYVELYFYFNGDLLIKPRRPWSMLARSMGEEWYGRDAFEILEYLQVANRLWHHDPFGYAQKKKNRIANDFVLCARDLGRTPTEKEFEKYRLQLALKK